MRGKFALLLSTVLVAFAPPWTLADLPAQIAASVDVRVYRHYLDDVLFTHEGDNRGPNSAQHDLARENIQALFTSFGLEVGLDPFTYNSKTYYNVVATLPGAIHPDAQLIVGAHYDSVSNPGADDNASGIAGILEIARVLSSYQFDYTVKFIAFDLEELGLLGSEAYVDEFGEDDIRGMIAMDMIAYSRTSYAAQIRNLPFAEDFAAGLGDAVLEYGNGLTIDFRGVSYGSDHSPFQTAGIVACEISERWLSRNPCYHKSCDHVDNAGYIDYEFASDITRSVAGFLAEQAGVLDLRPCMADLDGNQLVDLDDLALVLTAYALDDSGDLDHDGDTDAQDLSFVFASLGEICP